MERRTEPIQLYVTRSERRLIEALAGQEQITMSELIRQLIKQSAKSQNLWPLKPAKEKELA